MFVVGVNMDKLSREQLDKYYCSISLSDIKEEGQLKLLQSRVLVVGAGGLGSYVLPLLASSGVGFIGVIDNDLVNLNNLPRQTIYEYKDIGKYKVNVIKRRLERINPDIKVKTYKSLLTKSNGRIVKDYDLVIDCTDNFETKFLINDLCLKHNIPFITAGVSDYKGQVMMCIPHKSKDFKSLFDELPINIEEKYKDDDGVFPSSVAIIGSIAVNEALKYLLNIGSLLLDTLLVVDPIHNNYQKIKL